MRSILPIQIHQNYRTMRTLFEMAILVCLFCFFGAESSALGQPIDRRSSFDNSHLEGLPEILLPEITRLANEYKTGSDYGVERIQLGLGLSDLLLIRIGVPQDCLHKTQCLHALVREKADVISFVTPCEPGERNLYHQHRANGDIVSAFEFTCNDGSSFVVGISRSSISVNSQLKR